MIKRAISGIIYVTIMWIGTCYSQQSLHILFLILGITCLYEMWKLRKGKSLFTSYGIIPYLYVIIPFTLVHFITSEIILALFILIWVFDTFAYLIGSRFGKNKMLPSVSPKKSWEGFFGGLFFTIITFHLIIFTYTCIMEITLLLSLPLIISITASAGDFIASYYKRVANVKDSGNIIPGHGGMIDRMDSFLITIPIIYIILKLYY